MPDEVVIACHDIGGGYVGGATFAREAYQRELEVVEADAAHALAVVRHGSDDAGDVGAVIGVRRSRRAGNGHVFNLGRGVIRALDVSREVFMGVVEAVVQNAHANRRRGVLESRELPGVERVDAVQAPLLVRVRVVEGFPCRGGLGLDPEFVSGGGSGCEIGAIGSRRRLPCDHVYVVRLRALRYAGAFQLVDSVVDRRIRSQLRHHEVARYGFDAIGPNAPHVCSRYGLRELLDGRALAHRDEHHARLVFGPWGDLGLLDMRNGGAHLTLHLFACGGNVSVGGALGSRGLHRLLHWLGRQACRRLREDGHCNCDAEDRKRHENHGGMLARMHVASLPGCSCRSSRPSLSRRRRVIWDHLII